MNELVHIFLHIRYRPIAQTGTRAATVRYPAMTPPPIRPDGLQLDENRAFQERFWTIQRVAWGFYLLAILLALLGATGRSGPFAQGHARIGTAQITWPRITRRGTPDTLTVLLGAGTAPELTIGAELATVFQIESILPHPAMESGGTPLRFAFFPDPNAPYHIAFALRAQQSGLVRYAIGIGADSVTVTTLVLP